MIPFTAYTDTQLEYQAQSSDNALACEALNRLRARDDDTADELEGVDEKKDYLASVFRKEGLGAALVAFREQVDESSAQSQFETCVEHLHRECDYLAEQVEEQFDLNRNGETSFTELQENVLALVAKLRDALENAKP